MAKLTSLQRSQLVTDYEAGAESVGALVGRYGITRQRLYQLLDRAGIRKRRTGRCRRSCGHCRAKLSVTRWRAKLQWRVFCSRACYFAALHNPGYQDHSHSRRLARAKVREHFQLLDLEVIHHVDGDQRNNRLENLMLFASHGEHMRWHRRGGEKSGVVPLWRGSDVGRHNASPSSKP